MLIPAPDAVALKHYHLSPTGLRALDFTLMVPIAIIWFTLFYAYAKLYRYSKLIKSNKDGKAVVKLSQGLLAFAIGLPLSSILSTTLQLIARHYTNLVAITTIISNYLGVLYPLIAFIFISIGARGLSEISKSRPSLRVFNILVVAIIAIGVIFCDLIAHAHHSLHHTYHLSYGLVMLTLGIPYMYMWFLGLFAATEIYIYSRKVAGIVYRQSWNLLAIGLGSFILISIVLEYLSTLSTWLNGLSLPGVLLLLYVLLLLLASAFIVIALGTKELMKIEEA
ncbi:MAG TPA: hypothetical protein VLF69_02150 [Candidatus Saccharimonadales bacterium]|nr:hypothetical protein [Candidatus Saccharimonadales bacterium]